MNEAEADVVRRIFERSTAGRGAGLRTIAQELNAEAAPTPRPRRRTQVRGWAPSSVREILHRELYRGVIVYNRTRKRDRWGRLRQHRRNPVEQVRIIICQTQTRAAPDAASPSPAVDLSRLDTDPAFGP